MTRRLLRLLSLALVPAAVLAAGPAAVQAATPGWRLLAANGPTNVAPYASERQTVRVEPGQIFRLTFAGDTTPDLSGSAPANGPGSVEEALNALPSISAGGGSVSVVLGDVGQAYSRPGYVVSFDGGPLAGTDVPMLVSSAGTVDLTTSSTLAIFPTNVGGAATSGAYTITVELPDGLVTASTPSPPWSAGRPPAWSCPPGSGQTTFTCTRSEVLEPGNTLNKELDATPSALLVPVAAETPVEGTLTANLTISGGGAVQPTHHAMPIVISSAPAPPGVQHMWAGAFDADGRPETRAGAHPFLAAGGLIANTFIDAAGKITPVGDLRDVFTDLPAGFVGNPLATPRCLRAVVASDACDRDAVVGRGTAIYDVFGGPTASAPLMNVMPPDGSAAQLSFQAVLALVSTGASLRPSDYGVRATTSNLVGTYRPYGGFITLWGPTGDPAFDQGRCFGPGCAPVGSDTTATFLTNPTECTGRPLTTLVGVDTWQRAGIVDRWASDDSPPVTDCEDVPFTPVAEVRSSSSSADSASGLDFDLEVPQDGLLDPDAIAQSHVKDVTVRLPEGIAVNPSGATGLAACSDAQMDKGSLSAPRCPDGSKIGTVRVTSPLADHPIDGTMYLGTPKSTDPASGQMLRLWVVARDDKLGVMVKLPGSATADPVTGRLTATFESNPRLPFDHLSVKAKGGNRGVLATPQDCGPVSISTTLSPWSGAAPVTQDTSTSIAGDCSLGFAPTLAAGMSTQATRRSGSFSFRFSREDGEQWVDGLTAKLPRGLLASVKDVPLCTDSQAAAGACPAGSRIGTVDATAGSGNPFVLEQKGQAFLTEGYKGCPYGLAVVVPVVAGPFDGATPETDLGDIVVRQSVCVDRSTAEVSAVSDPLPTIWHGIPLRVRSVTVNIDRPGFMLNPSDCDAKQVGASFHSARGATAGAAVPFNTSGCAALAFKPKLTLALTGRGQTRTGKHPGINAQVTQQGVSEAGIEKAVVRLPKSLALDVNNAQALCEFVDGTKPDLENRCPKGSIVGRARAKTPLLKDDLVGNVYFVKNVRIDSKTGNQIRTLPMIIVALRGEIAINLVGGSSTTKAGKLVNTFASVPDAPISRFNLNITGGKNGIIAVTRTRKAKISLCAGRHIAEADMDGQNGRRHDFDVRMKTPCTKKQTKRAKRAAARAKRG